MNEWVTVVCFCDLSWSTRPVLPNRTFCSDLNMFSLPCPVRTIQVLSPRWPLRPWIVAPVTYRPPFYNIFHFNTNVSATCGWWPCIGPHKTWCSGSHVEQIDKALFIQSSPFSWGREQETRAQMTSVISSNAKCSEDDDIWHWRGTRGEWSRAALDRWSKASLTWMLRRSSRGDVSRKGILGRGHSKNKGSEAGTASLGRDWAGEQR